MATYFFAFRGGMMTNSDASPEQLQAHFQKWMTWIGELRAQTDVGGEPLQPGGVTLRGPGKTVSDGPYAELKDLVTGFLTVEAESLEAAVEMAKGCPIFEDHDSGSVEVRPVASMAG